MAKLSGFKVPTLDSGFKISGAMTKPGCFYFGFVLMCVNGKTNPLLKGSGFIRNPEQFPLLYVNLVLKLLQFTVIVNNLYNLNNSLHLSVALFLFSDNFFLTIPSEIMKSPLPSFKPRRTRYESVNYGISNY